MAKNTINIYLNKDERTKIDNLKVKYQLSLTTITDILVMVTTKVFTQKNDPELLNRLMNTYLYKNGKKTSIKTPSLFKKDSLFSKQEHKSRYTTNVIKIYLKHDIKTYINDPKLIEMYWNECNEKMTKTKDEFWDYNKHVRYQRRMLRENKEYLKKALETV